MTDNIVLFPSAPDPVRKKQELADYLRNMADFIEQGIILDPPAAMMMVLTSECHHEVLHVGYGETPGLLSDASRAVSALCTGERGPHPDNKFDRSV